jgi:N-acyl-D-aspartate/D-glutamate deacylase
MVPHGSIRREVMGMTDRDPTAQELARMVDKTVLMVTHERDLTQYFTRSIALADGVIVSEANGGSK